MGMSFILQRIIVVLFFDRLPFSRILQCEDATMLFHNGKTRVFCPRRSCINVVGTCGRVDEG